MDLISRANGSRIYIGWEQKTSGLNDCAATAVTEEYSIVCGAVQQLFISRRPSRYYTARVRAAAAAAHNWFRASPRE